MNKNNFIYRSTSNDLYDSTAQPQQKHIYEGLRKQVYDWCLGSSTHGLSNIARSKNIYIKLIWILFFCASTVYCVFTIYLATLDYLRHDVYVNYKIQQQIPSQFPAISICNLKSINKNFAMDYIDTVLTENDLKNLTGMYDTPLDTTTTQAYLFRALLLNSNLTNSIRKFGFELDDMLLSCSFGAKYCYSQNFTWFFHSLYGNCFTFNDGIKSEIEKVVIPGYRYGLQLEIFLGEPKLQTKYEINDGIIIFVHNQSKATYILDHGITVATNVETNIGIKRTFLRRLPKPHGLCIENLSQTSVFDSKIFNYIVRHLNVSYSQELCFTFCIQILVQRNCNCSNAEMPIFENTTSSSCGGPQMCISEDDINCMYDTLGSLDQQTIDKECMNECPLECNSIFYDTTFSTATYPSMYYKKLLLRNPKIKSTRIDSNHLSRSVLKVNIFYENLQYTLVEEVALLTLEGFVSSIGGTVGLFLGMSILSAIDVIHISLCLVYTYFFANK